MTYFKEYIKSWLYIAATVSLIHLLLCASGFNGGQLIAWYLLFLCNLTAIAGPIKIMIEKH